jgi:hypothetical protein
MPLNETWFYRFFLSLPVSSTVWVKPVAQRCIDVNEADTVSRSPRQATSDYPWMQGAIFSARRIQVNKVSWNKADDVTVTTFEKHACCLAKHPLSMLLDGERPLVTDIGSIRMISVFTDRQTNPTLLYPSTTIVRLSPTARCNHPIRSGTSA